jgi:hypothetical protein
MHRDDDHSVGVGERQKIPDLWSAKVCLAPFWMPLSPSAYVWLRRGRRSLTIAVQVSCFLGAKPGQATADISSQVLCGVHCFFEYVAEVHPVSSILHLRCLVRKPTAIITVSGSVDVPDPCTSGRLSAQRTHLAPPQPAQSAPRGRRNCSLATRPVCSDLQAGARLRRGRRLRRPDGPSRSACSARVDPRAKGTCMACRGQREQQHRLESVWACPDGVAQGTGSCEGQHASLPFSFVVDVFRADSVLCVCSVFSPAVAEPSVAHRRGGRKKNKADAHFLTLEGHFGRLFEQHHVLCFIEAINVTASFEFLENSKKKSLSE